MKTKDVIEALLYVNGNSKDIQEKLSLCHLDLFESKPHLELFFIDKFKFPKFLVIVDKLLHVYILGDKEKGKTRNVLKIDGFNAQHLLMTKSDIRNQIKEDADFDNDLYLPEVMIHRIIYINDDIVVFNKHNSNKFWTKGEWSLGVDFYKADINTYTLHPYEILTKILDDE